MSKRRGVNSPDSERSTHVTPPKLAHEYRFNEGDKIGRRYQVIAPLGFGGFSEVYQCEHLGLGRIVAVKVLTEIGVGFKEALSAAKLKHPHIVYVQDVFALEDGTPYIIFDYIEGETLETLLNREHRLLLGEKSLRIVQQIAEALDYAHSRGVIHRDIKPSNIILDRQGNAYLTDFGLADVKRPKESEPERISMRMTGDKDRMSEEVQRRLSGTIPYMAPEQLKGETHGDALSDLYSLGVVTYEMLTGQIPYRGHAASLIYQITTNEPTSPVRIHEAIPKGVGKVLLRALDKSPEQRFESCAVFAEALRTASHSYVTANDQYEKAKSLYEAQQWRHALAEFEILDDEAPGFKDTSHYLEQTRHHVQLLKLYEEAQNKLGQEKYQEVLDILKSLTQLEPEYEGAEALHKQAITGRAQEVKRSLDEQYEQAVQQFEQGEYQACLDTLAVIRQRAKKYPDSRGIEAPAKKQVELRERYSKGLSQIRQGKHQEAVATFVALKRDAPDYEGVDSQLVSARILARIDRLLQEARAFLGQEKFTACMEKLDKLQQLGVDYKQDDVGQLRQETIDALHRRITRLLHEGEFDESQQSLAELRTLLSAYPELEEPSDIEELTNEVQESIRIRNLRTKLNQVFQQATTHLKGREFEKALELCDQIKQQRENLEFPGLERVEREARTAYGAELYTQAVGVFAQPDPQPERALELLGRAREVDPGLRDSQLVEKRALAMQIYAEAVEALEKERPAQALELWGQVREIDPSYLDAQQVEERAHTLRIYNEAAKALAKGNSERAIKLWRQVREMDPSYLDKHHVERRAQAMRLYFRAVEALEQEDYDHARELWRRVREIDPEYADSHQVEERTRERRRKTRKRILVVGGSILTLLCLVVAVAVAAGGWQYVISAGPFARPTMTTTPRSTLTSTSPAPAIATTRPPNATTSPSSTPTSTSTPTPTPTLTPSPTSTLTSSPSPTNTSVPVPTGDAIVKTGGAQLRPGCTTWWNPRVTLTAGTELVLLGSHSSCSGWLYVGTEDGSAVGWTQTANLQVYVNTSGLSPVTPVPTLTPMPPTPTPKVCEGGPLRLDAWSVNKFCTAGGWTATIYVAGHGGDCMYTYYWEQVEQGGPMPGSMTFDISSAGYGVGLVGQASVTSAGETAVVGLLIPAPNCGQD